MLAFFNGTICVDKALSKERVSVGFLKLPPPPQLTPSGKIGKLQIG